jgi:hypothetical protein
MRKIKSDAELDRAQRRNNLILGIVMIGLIVLSSAGYAIMSAVREDASDIVEEMGLSFSKVSGYWTTDIEGRVFYFSYLPSEVDSVDVEFNMSLVDYYGKPLYFVGSGEGSGEIVMNLKDYVLRYQGACLNSSVDCDESLPVKDCSSNVIVLEEGDGVVYGDGSCVWVVGDLRSADAFLYEMLGVFDG